MDKDIVIALISLVGVLCGVYIAWRKLKSEIEVLRSQAHLNQSTERVNQSEEQSNLAKALHESIDALLKTSADRNQLEEKVDKQQTQINELIQHRNEREGRIVALENNVRSLLDQVREWESKYNALKEKYNKAIEILVRALDDAHIPVPIELVHLLGDSIAKFKLPKPGMK